jgi:hypothetical protein
VPEARTFFLLSAALWAINVALALADVSAWIRLGVLVPAVAFLAAGLWRRGKSREP